MKWRDDFFFSGMTRRNSEKIRVVLCRSRIYHLPIPSLDSLSLRISFTVGLTLNYHLINQLLKGKYTISTIFNPSNMAGGAHSSPAKRSKGRTFDSFRWAFGAFRDIPSHHGEENYLLILFTISFIKMFFSKITIFIISHYMVAIEFLWRFAGNSYASLVLSKLSPCMQTSIYALI